MTNMCTHLKAWGLLGFMCSLILTACGNTPAIDMAIPTDVATTTDEDATIPAIPNERTASNDIPDAGGRLVIALSAEPDTLDLYKSSLSVSDTVGSHIGAALIAKDAEGQIVPYLAEEWDVSADGLTYTFIIKEGITFHDNTPLTTEDLAYSFNRARDPETASPVSGFFVKDLAMAEALDERTLQLTLNQPSFYFLNTLTVSDGYLMPISQRSIEETGDAFGRKPISVGPYMLKEWQTGDRIVLQRNPDFTWGPDFWGDNAPYIETIEYRIIPENATILAGLESGEVDVANVQGREAPRLEASGFQVFSASAQGPLYLNMNTSQPPFDDVLVRRAFSFAVDRHALIKIAANDAATPQYGPLSASQAGYWPGGEKQGYQFDLEQAKQTMIEAGYTLEADGTLTRDGTPFELILVFPAGGEVVARVAQVLQEQFKALGVQLELQQEESSTYYTNLNQGAYPLSITGISYPDATMLELMFHSEGSLNSAQVRDPELDELLKNISSTVDPQAQQEWANQTQQYIIEQAYFIPLWTAQSFTIINNRVNNVTFADPYMFLQSAHIAPE